jgi:predicted CoA-binding protein
VTDLTYSNDLLRHIFQTVRTIAIVGASNNPQRASYGVMEYLLQQGYQCFPVNPALVGQQLLGQTVYADLSHIPQVPDMVDIFRHSDAAGEIADQSVELGVKVIWMQLGVRHDAAAQRAQQAGVTMIMDRCPKIEIPRLAALCR